MTIAATLVQLDTLWEDKPGNHARIGALLEHSPPAAGGLLVLPEMFDTGFSMRTERTAAQHEESRAFLAQLAVRYGCYAIGSTPWPAGGHTESTRDGRGPVCVNRCFVFTSDGTEACVYDKVHPFSFGREPERFLGGQRVGVFDAGGLSVMPTVCYDLRFPELYRAGVARGAECIVVVANWPDARCEHWRTLLVARAIENQAIVVGVNRAGRDPGFAYAGGSMVVGAKGEVLIEADAEECVAHAELPVRAMREWRRVFPALRDRKIRTLDGS